MTNQRAALVRRQHGLITAQAAREAGLEPFEIAELLRTGEWVKVRRGVYIDADQWVDAERWREKPLLQVRAADLTLQRPHVFSHDSAALIHDLPLLRDDGRLVHVTRSGVTGSRRRNGIMQHGARYDADDVSEIDGLRTLGIARTALDICREHGYSAGLVACDAALRRGVLRSELLEVAESMHHWPDITEGRAAVADADPGAETAGESMARILVRELQLGEVTTQFPVPRPNGRTAWVDLLVDCHVFEFDGRTKYRNVADGGVATREAEAIAWEEKEREIDVRAQDLGVSRITWRDFWGAGRVAARARLRREAELTAQRHGRVPSPELLAYAARMADVRQRRLLIATPQQRLIVPVR
jgi:hypothetical protein